MISVDCNDIAYNLCRCPECKKLQEQYQSPGGPLFDYLIELCALMRKEHPDIMVKTLAYQATQTEPPPAVEKLPDNLVVIFAPINSNFLAPFDHPTNSGELKNLRGWCGKCKNVWVWYYPNTYKNNKNFFAPPPVGNLDRIAKDIRMFKKLGVSGAYFEHDSGGLQYCTNFSELQTWIMLRLFQNPAQELAPLVTEFTDFYYGEAAPLMREHLYELEGLSQKLISQNMRWSYNKLAFPYLTQENIARWQARFDRMEDLTKDYPDTNFHVRLARFGLDAAELTLFGASWDKATFDKRARRLSKTFAELRTKRLPNYERMYIRKVDGTLDEWLAKMGKRTSIPPTGIPEELKSLGKERVAMANPDYLTLDVDKAAVKEADADLGMAVFENTDGKDFEFGFYDAFNKRFGRSRTVKKAEIVPDTYKLYKLGGLVKLSPDCLLWGGSWRLSVPLGHLCPPDDPRALKDEWELFASLKFEGPAYSTKTADKPNRVLCDRVVLVKAAN